MVFESPNSVIELQSDVLKILSKYRQNRAGKIEACGVLIGEGDIDQGIYKIVKITTPMYRDIRRRASFRIVDAKHQKVVDKEWNKYSGKRFYLGFWHTHPEAFPSPSALDLKSWIENYNLNDKHTPSLIYQLLVWKRSQFGRYVIQWFLK